MYPQETPLQDFSQLPVEDQQKIKDIKNFLKNQDFELSRHGLEKEKERLINELETIFFKFPQIDKTPIEKIIEILHAHYFESENDGEEHSSHPAFIRTQERDISDIVDGYAGYPISIPRPNIDRPDDRNDGFLEDFVDPPKSRKEYFAKIINNLIHGLIGNGFRNWHNYMFYTPYPGVCYSVENFIEKLKENEVVKENNINHSVFEILAIIAHQMNDFYSKTKEILNEFLDVGSVPSAHTHSKNSRHPNQNQMEFIAMLQDINILEMLKNIFQRDDFVDFLSFMDLIETPLTKPKSKRIRNFAMNCDGFRFADYTIDSFKSLRSMLK